MNSYQKAFKTYKTNKVLSTKVLVNIWKISAFFFFVKTVMCITCKGSFLNLFIYSIDEYNVFRSYSSQASPNTTRLLCYISLPTLCSFYLTHSNCGCWHGTCKISSQSILQHRYGGDSQDATPTWGVIGPWWPLGEKKNPQYFSVVWLMLDTWPCYCAWHPLAMHALAVQIELIGL